MFECRFKSTTTTWYRNGRRRRLTDAAECLWHALKDCSDPYGAMQADPDDIAHALFAGRKGWTAAKVAKELALLSEVGLVRLYEHDGQPWIQVEKHDEHQASRFIDKRGARKSPEYARNGSNSRQITPSGSEGPYGLWSVVCDISSKDESSANAKDETQGDTQRVFDHWRDQFGKRATTVLDKPRTQRIAWALETYGLPLALDCITGYALDSWPLRRRPYNHELTLLLRDAKHFEQGLDLLAESANARLDVAVGSSTPEQDAARLKQQMNQATQKEPSPA